MIAATLISDPALARLDHLPDSVRSRLSQSVEALSRQLRARIVRKLSGEVLRQHTGRLASSIEVNLTQNGGAIGASLSSDVDYASIHEYGGMIPAREMLPRRGRVLAFPWKGQQRFFARVELPSVTMPERSFLRSALDEMAPAIRSAMADAVRAAMQT